MAYEGLAGIGAGCCPVTAISRYRVQLDELQPQCWSELGPVTNQPRQLSPTTIDAVQCAELVAAPKAAVCTKSRSRGYPDVATQPAIILELSTPAVVSRTSCADMSFKNPTASLNALLKAATVDDHEEILSKATDALKSSPNDTGIRNAQVVALLKLDRFDDALRVIETSSRDLQQACLLERAYALYKTGRLPEARECLRPAVSAKARGALHLDAQVAYRDEQFEDAHAIVTDLLSVPDDNDEEHDLRINLSAVSAQISWECGEVASSPSDGGEPDNFELAYNAACEALARGRLEKAVQLLTLATRLCDSSDDLSDEEKQAEMVPILVQQAYAYSKMGLQKEAADVYQSIDSSLYVHIPTVSSKHSSHPKPRN